MGGAIIVVICIVGSIVWGLYGGQKRRGAMDQLAETLECSFTRERNYQIARHYPFLDILTPGSNRYGRNTMKGTYRNREICLFDYHYETASSEGAESRKTYAHDLSFYTLKLDKSFPALWITAKDRFSPLETVGAGDKIDIGSPPFTQRFEVRATDNSFATDFCAEDMIDYLLEQPDRHILIEDCSLIMILEEALQSETIETHLAQLLKIRSLMPDHLF